VEATMEPLPGLRERERGPTGVEAAAGERVVASVVKRAAASVVKRAVASALGPRLRELAVAAPRAGSEGALPFRTFRCPRAVRR
jgi:hypothetical protein